MKNSILLLFLFVTNFSHAKIWLPTIISDNMVLQQESIATIWGWSTDTYSDEQIIVSGSWSETKVTTKTDQGKWSVQLPTPPAGGPFTLTITGHETIRLQNVMIGELWICSGQSNMEWTPLQNLANAEEEIQQAQYPGIRFFFLPKHKSPYPQDDTPGHWVPCSPETVKMASSVSYFFGRELNKKLGIPIGLINTSWGGTPIETWIPKELILGDWELKAESEKLARYEGWPKELGVTYNAMIHPLINFDIAGTIWYQGESNRNNAFSYYQSFPLLIKSWRNAWKKEFPFYFVQIAPYKYDAGDPVDAAVVRDAQLNTMQEVSNTGMVVTNDIGDLEDIHPANKQDVGKRLALWALAKTYGRTDVVYSGPIFKSMEIRESKAIISFDYADNGLIQKGVNLREFLIAGADKTFHPAKAAIEGNTVVVSSVEVPKPVAVRFAFTNIAQPNLFNTTGLPASAFRTDDWEIKIE